MRCILICGIPLLFAACVRGQVTAFSSPGSSTFSASAHARRTITLADIATARKAADLHPDSAKDIVSLATLLYEIGEKSAASALFEKALHLDASLSSAWYYHGLVASDDGKWNAAAEDFRRD